MPEDDKSKIDRLRDALYSRKVKIKPSFVLDLHGHQSAVSDKWKDPLPEAPLTEKPKVDLSKKIFWAAITFFAICLLVAGYIFLAGSNLISPNNIKVDILGPSSVKAGEVTSLDVTVTNNNDTALEIADLIIEYPEGTRNADNWSASLTHTRVSLGDIAPRQSVRKTVSAVLYGEEGKPIHVPMSIEYRLPNSTSVFQKDIAYNGLVGTSPLNVSVEALKEVNAQQSYTLKVTVTSNARSVEHGVILAADLPKGFDVVSVTPKPVSTNVAGAPTTWDLGDIEAGGTRVIMLTGKVYGDKDEQRYFKFVAGVAGSQNKNLISAVIAKVTHTVDIKQPFIGLSLLLDRKEADTYVARSGGEVGGQILWKNNLGVPVYDVTIDALLSGDIIKTDTIKAGVGFYDSNKDTIRWNKSYNKALQTFTPGQTGGVEFAMFLWPPGVPAVLGAINPEFTLDITVHAKRRLEAGVPEDIVSTIRKSVKVASVARLTSQIVHSVGPIENSGELPLRVGQKTTYTVMWAVTNTFNKLGDAKVSATLPDYVTWEDIVSPSSENISYNPTSRVVTWSLGNVDTQTASGPSVRRVAFQVGIVPSESQKETGPILQNVANFSANDTFTGLTLTDENEALDTRITTDPEYKFGDELVKK